MSILQASREGPVPSADRRKRLDRQHQLGTRANLSFFFCNANNSNFKHKTGNVALGRVYCRNKETLNLFIDLLVFFDFHTFFN